MQGQWGGLPYKDLLAGYQHVLKHYKAIDPQRTAALGASYGGFMVNWIQGHNFGFKALVCHDGVFDTEAVWYETEELYFPEQENCGFSMLGLSMKFGRMLNVVVQHLMKTRKNTTSGVQRIMLPTLLRLSLSSMEAR